MGEIRRTHREAFFLRDFFDSTGPDFGAGKVPHQRPLLFFTKDSVTLRPVMVHCFILLGKERDHNLEKLNTHSLFII